MFSVACKYSRLFEHNEQRQSHSCLGMDPTCVERIGLTVNIPGWIEAQKQACVSCFAGICPTNPTTTVAITLNVFLFLERPVFATEFGYSYGVLCALSVGSSDDAGLVRRYLLRQLKLPVWISDVQGEALDLHWTMTWSEGVASDQVSVGSTSCVAVNIVTQLLSRQSCVNYFPYICKRPRAPPPLPAPSFAQAGPGMQVSEVSSRAPSDPGPPQVRGAAGAGSWIAHQGLLETDHSQQSVVFIGFATSTR